MKQYLLYTLTLLLLVSCNKEDNPNTPINCKGNDYIKNATSIEFKTIPISILDHFPAGLELTNSPFYGDLVIIYPEIGQIWSSEGSYQKDGDIGIIEDLSYEGDDLILTVKGAFQRQVLENECGCKNISSKVLRVTPELKHQVKFIRKKNISFNCYDFLSKAPELVPFSETVPNNQVLFSWKAVQNQDISYELQVSKSSFWDAKKGFKEVFNAFTIDSTHHLHKMYNGIYYWSVRSMNGNATHFSSPQTVKVHSTVALCEVDNLIDLDHIEINKTCTIPIKIRNSGDSTLSISNIILPTNYSASWNLVNIPSGKTKTLDVYFTPNELGNYADKIIIESNASNGPQEIVCQSNVLNEITIICSLSSSSANFGETVIGDDEHVRLIIKNTGNTKLIIEDIEFPEAFSFMGSKLPIAVLPGKSSDLHLYFTPLSAINYESEMVIKSNAQNGEQRVNLKGIGITSSRAICSIESVLDFGEVKTNRHSNKQVIIKNEGTSKLKIKSMSTTYGYSIDSNPTSISAGQSASVTVEFSPVTATIYNGVLTVFSNATNGIVICNLRGKGIEATCNLNTDYHDFGDIDIGSEKQKIIQITNKGKAPLTINKIITDHPFSVNSVPTIINGGSSSNFYVKFKPEQIGQFKERVVVKSDAANGDQIVEVRGVGYGALCEASVSSVEFYPIEAGETSTHKFTIRNEGNKNLNIKSISTPSGFSIYPSSGYIRQGSSQDFTISFKPTTSEKKYKGTINISSNAVNGNQTISVYGESL